MRNIKANNFMQVEFGSETNNAITLMTRNTHNVI